MKRRQSTIAIAGFIGTVLLSCTNNTKNDLKILTMLTSPDYPPYAFYDTSTGRKEIVGFDIDIAKYIAKELNFELRVNISSFDGIIPALEAKKSDFAMNGITPTAEREQKVDFSVLYFDSKDVILTLKGKNLRKVEDLATLTVGVQTGTTQEEGLKARAAKLKGIKIISLSQFPALVKEVKEQKIDAAIIEDAAAQGFKKGNQELGSDLGVVKDVKSLRDVHCSHE